MRRAERALTLLEVMAAVALLGILYTFLAKAATQGVRSEAESRRRMEASLLADATLAEIETLLAAGETLKFEQTEEEYEDEEFWVSVEVTPFQLPPELAGELAETVRGVPSVFGAGDADAPSLLQRVAVRVVWDDGIFERSVERVTFALDGAAVLDLEGRFGMPPGAPR
jgi:prepilin-type N-terminal cleavage/methylation domain-containing protein